MGYTDAMNLGESVSSVLDILEGNKLSEEGDKVLYGDNQSGLRLLESPDGPWRTRHLRLRSFVLRERMKWGLWKSRHVPGAQLASDLLTKAVTSMPSWTKFYNFMGMYRLDELGAAEPSSCTEGRVTAKVAGAVLAAIIGLTVVTTLDQGSLWHKGT